MKYFLLLLLSMAVVLVNSTILVSNGSFIANLAVIQKNLIPESYFNVFGLENMPPVGQVFFFTALLFFGIVLILASFGVL